LCAEKPYVPKKIISTLTLSILKSVYTLISLILFNKLYSVATLGQLKPLLLEYYVRIVALMPNLQRVSFYSIIEFFYYSFTTKLILFLILIKGFYLSFKALLLYRKSLLALWLGYYGGGRRLNTCTRCPLRT